LVLERCGVMLESSAHRDAPHADVWFDWLLRIRHGADAAYAVELQHMLDGIRDRVLDHAGLRPGQQLADVGSGDGLIAFGALARDPTVEATFVDISPALIGYTQELAQRRGLLQRCRFVVASAESLAAIPDASFDVVTARAVIAYLSDKLAAIRELRRILRPGGRVSTVDPVFQDQAYALAGIASQLRAGETGSATAYFEFLHRCGSAHLPDTLLGIRENPLTNFTERDLLRLFEVAGFVNIHLRLHIDSVPALPVPWQVYLATSPRAGAPTMGDILATRFDQRERTEFERLFRRGIEAGAAVERRTNAFIFADSA
jgi:arsenite methyltransferase